METGTGPERPGVSTPPSGPLPTLIDKVAGYALQLHAEFWSSIPAKKRTKIISNFVARAKEAGTADLAKNLVRGFGVDVPDFGAAAAILAGYGTQQWVIVSWAGPQTGFVPNSAARPTWVANLVDDKEEADADAEDKDEDSTATEATPATAMSPLTLKRLRKRKGAPRWSDKLAKLIQAHWGDVDGVGATVPASEIWQVILGCDSAGKKHLKERAKEDKRKAKAKEKKAKGRAAKEKKAQKKGKKRRDSTSSSSSSDTPSSSSSSSSNSRSSSSSSSSSYPI